MRVLLVEDHEDTRELFATYLSSAGYTVETAITGLQAVDMALARPPDAVVLDGWALARHLRANEATKHAVIVACSARAFPDDEQKAKAAGCDAFVAKPCPPSELVAAVEQSIKSRR